MAMSEEEILREAARIRASRRRRVAKTCERCGTSFIGVAQAKYCSDACRMAAARERTAGEQEPDIEQEALKLEPMLPGESYREFFERIAGRPPAGDEEELIDAMERIKAIWAKIGHSVDDSTEIIRREREARSEYLANL